MGLLPRQLDLPSIPTDQNLLISSRNTWAVYKVDRTTGKVLWKLGGKHGDFKMGPRTHFAFQHHVTLYPGGVLTIFDNEGGPPNEASQSRGLVLSIDEKRRRATFRKQYHHHPPVLSQALGSVQQLDRGHAFVGWGSVELLHRVWEPAARCCSTGDWLPGRRPTGPSSSPGRGARRGRPM